MVEIEMLERVNETEDNDNEGKQRIVKLQHHFATKGPNGTHLCMVFEAEEMNLYDLLIHSKFKGIPLENVRCIIKQVLEGLSFLHEKCGIIHTDIKPENVLLCVDNNSFSETSSLGWNKPQGSATLHRKGQGKEQILATGIHYKVQDIEGKLSGNYSYSPRQT
ncbi:serine/threonine-protein kinase SRPK-like [Macrosteles quadrilineatus]|uniref:serine/threonine-protein kinase SRPK-like n=1 Tax=Macrosteles quadrilineatus TaxID=74068 RepID=UPI0023E15211|nr:serine/threonine-protein kinase SRPK-like [Macrosteles quadrilineatus]XP_054281089.1 serine/threonine-protein kinase SRPK-like [Macrosteles quadrilineatus]